MLDTSATGTGTERVTGIGPQDHADIGRSANIPVTRATSIISVSPIVLPAQGRVAPLQMRVSAPTTGADLPIILLAHGNGASNNLSSLRGYGPLVDFWAAHGFVVIQPTHLDSKTLDFGPETPGAPLFWRERVEDMKTIFDQLDAVEAAVPALQGRLDGSRIAIAGHSMGGHTAGMLLGAQLTDENGEKVNLIEPRFKAGLMMCAPGSGGGDLSENAAKNYGFLLHPDFSKITTQTLMVVGDHDINPFMTVRGPDWYVEPYIQSPGPKCLLSMTGGGHILGGISGYDAAEAGDENVERVAAVQRMTWSYLRSALYPEDTAWADACAALRQLDGVGRVEYK